MSLFSPSQPEHKYSPEQAHVIDLRLYKLAKLDEAIEYAPIQVVAPLPSNVVHFRDKFKSPNYVEPLPPEAVIRLEEEEELNDGLIDEMHREIVGDVINLDDARRRVEEAHESAA
jgi:hypothetical protein